MKVLRTAQHTVSIVSDFQVGDNSAVNLIPILAGDIKEALAAPKLDEYGDINPNYILPLDKKILPSSIEFLWDRAKSRGQFSLKDFK